MKRFVRKVLTALAVLFSLSCLTNAFAQSTAVNLYLGAGPGVTKIGQDFKYSTLSYFADLEYATEGFNILFEGAYNQMKYKDTDYEIDPSLSVGLFMGPTIFPGQRFQIPVMVGLGIATMQGAPSAYVSLDGIARAKFYLFNRFGLFAGVAGGFGNTSGHFFVKETRRTWGRLEAGITYSFKIK